MFAPKSVIPKGEMIVRGAVCFPEYKESGSYHFQNGVLLVGGFHVGTRKYHILGELEFEHFRNEDVYNFFEQSPTDLYYCGQSKDIIKKYRKDINFAASLGKTEVRVCRYDCLDRTQSRYSVFGLVQKNELFYKRNGIVYEGINRFSVAKNEFPPPMKALVCLLSGIERVLYNDDRFTAAIQ